MNLHNAARTLGREGGKRRAAVLDPAARKHVAIRGAEARWGRLCGACGERRKDGRTDPTLGWVCKGCDLADTTPTPEPLTPSAP